MIILDTNVISEVFRPEMNEAVRRWLDAQNATALHLTATVLGEIRYGIELMQPGRRRTVIESIYLDIKAVHFPGRILPFDAVAAELAAVFRVRRLKEGRPVGLADCEIAGIALANGFALATRNTRDFDGFGLTLINPFEIETP